MKDVQPPRAECKGISEQDRSRDRHAPIGRSRKIMRNLFTDDELLCLSGYSGITPQKFAFERHARKRRLLRPYDLRTQVIGQWNIGWKTPAEVFSEKMME
ncbi:hypothetical protein [Pseudooceanicola nitratireducens]|uniref:hypothetical protein n=1 Tax=Pseudooceanicola nitratireducens TaxID=517719 RepID=UPI001C980D72|nr:hypothetical protein [Pseudooceanicola nitratireducens]MBY6159070.1 hypothetical protein [Pseudooceanicola nitratireducens]